MSVLPEVLAANAEYVESFGDRGSLALPPARRFAILTCMDARLDPAKYAGLAEGDAHVIRNAGGTGKFEVVTLKTAAYEALYSGAADFTVPFVTWEGIEAELHKHELRTFAYTDYGFPDFYQVVLAANQPWIAAHRDLAQRFIRATVRGFESLKTPAAFFQPSGCTPNRLPRSATKICAFSSP